MLYSLSLLCLSSLLVVCDAQYYPYNNNYNTYNPYKNYYNNYANNYNNAATLNSACSAAGYTGGYLASCQTTSGCAYHGGQCVQTTAGYLCCRRGFTTGVTTNTLFFNNVGACNNRGTVMGSRTCTDRSMCGPNQACYNGVCCPKGALGSDYICGGDSAVSQCFTGNTCGLNYNCVSGYCCECPSGRQNGRCTGINSSVGCPAGYTCNASGWCCSTSTSGGACPNNRTPNGNCVGTLCPNGFTCVGNVCCSN